MDQNQLEQICVFIALSHVGVGLRKSLPPTAEAFQQVLNESATRRRRMSQKDTDQ